MSKRRFSRVTQSLYRDLQRLAHQLSQSPFSLFFWGTRSARHRRQQPAAGFVLPTTVLLVLVVTLTVGTLLFRAYTRNNQVIGQTQQRVIYNAATPAIDRARAKVEALFNDSRLPSGVPPETSLVGILLNDGSNGVPQLKDASGTATEPFKLADEQWLDLNGDKKNDSAWVYRTDTDGNGTPDATVVYSIIFQLPKKKADGSIDEAGLVTISPADKAKGLYVRSAPLTNQQRVNCAVPVANEGGWLQDQNTTGVLRKNLQMSAIIIPDPVNGQSRGTFATLEMQQDRQLDRGNKWGAWFRYDMELSPGDAFNWNGAIHTEGSLFNRTGSNGSIRYYLVSAPKSCLMTSPANSEITITQRQAPKDQPKEFLGSLVSGSIQRNEANDFTVSVDSFPLNPNPVNTTLTRDNDSSTASSPADLALTPQNVLINDTNVSNSTTDSTNKTLTVNGWSGLPGADLRNRRIFNQFEKTPNVDDFYRADNRWGPKPRYKEVIVTSAYGTPIPNSNTVMVSDGAGTEGLDGYWERRARNEGLRVIVGQRLELGNAFVDWTKDDPLYPPTAAPPPAGREHEARQRKTLRDNLAAVQSAAIYHQASSKDFPVACLASTAHPGTPTTLQNSLTFTTATIGGTPRLITDFLKGNGTNGWEFAPPAGTEANFVTAIASGQPLGNALRNLAQFAGDHVSDTQTGAFPPTQAAAGGVVHPYPLSTMWGNFSELRRIIFTRLNTVGYPDLSPAEKTTLHTAACTLGMLAYNLQTIYAAPPSDPLRIQVDRDRTNGFSPVGGSPRYPALFYLFPKLDHGHDGTGAVPQPSTEPYIDPRTTYDPSNYIGTTLNPPNPTRYRVVGGANPDDFTGVVIQPRSATFTGTDGSGAWVLPYIPNANVSTNRITAPDGRTPAVGFLDRVIMNGREMMAVRVMDIDLKLLRDTKIGTDFWLPAKTGMVYAFREDAVREDAIARPANGSNPTNVTDPASPKDPALVANNNGVPASIKPVDFVPDPDRRPFGFRLRNGADISRTGTTVGLTFVSDNPVYIQGDFNLHSTNGTTQNLEEFKAPDNLQANYSNFYTRTNLDTSFADPSTDRWRVVEILSDAITLLSKNFDGKDGVIADTFTGATSGTSSFLNQNLPTLAGGSWVREDGTTNTEVPVKVDRNGAPVISAGTLTYADFSSTAKQTVMPTAEDTVINAILVSGLVPSKAGLYNGGLPNFPRMLENWNGKQLRFAGSFLQFNFSNYGTGLFDQEGWQTGTGTTAAEYNYYYRQPSRFWGYDPALQLVPAGPFSQRLITLNNRRSEYYKELPVNDPYINQLCKKAKGVNGAPTNYDCPE